MNKTANTKQGFTLIELLTVIAILAILGAIIFPTVGQFRTLAKKSSDSSDLRNIVQASQLFAAQNGERLVGPEQTLGVGGVVDTGGVDLIDVAAVLAYGGELEDPKTWISANETFPETATGGLFTFTAATAPATEGTYAASTLYEPEDFSFSYVTGLETSDSANTPVVFTRQSGTAGSWDAGDPYGNDGGHVAFLGGSVNWYDGTLENRLVQPTGQPADTIAAAIPVAVTNIKEAEAATTPTP